MSNDPIDTTDALLAIVNEIRLLREQQAEHYKAGIAMEREQHAERMLRAEQDTDRRIAAGKNDLAEYMSQFAEILKQHDEARKAQQDEIDALRASLNAVLEKRPPS